MWQGGKLTCQPAISLCYRLMAGGHGRGSLVYVQPSMGNCHMLPHTENTKLSQMVQKQQLCYYKGRQIFILKFSKGVA